MNSNDSQKSNKKEPEIESLDQLVEEFEPFVTDLYELVKKHESPDGLLGSFEDFYPIMMELTKLQSLLGKFTKPISVMFTDLKDFTARGENRGDWGAHVLNKKYKDIAEPIIEEKGVKVKDLGDGTLSYFDYAGDAVRAAALIQDKIRKYNARKKPENQIHLRIGIHTGFCLVDTKDIHGDVVNVASRIETLAEPGEVYFSEKTYELLDKKEFKCLEIGERSLKGKQESFKLFKLNWTQIKLDEDTGKKEPPEPVKKKTGTKKEPTPKNKKPPEVRIHPMRLPAKPKAKKKEEEKAIPLTGKSKIEPQPPSQDPPLKVKIHPLQIKRPKKDVPEIKTIIHPEAFGNLKPKAPGAENDIKQVETGKKEPAPAKIDVHIHPRLFQTKTKSTGNDEDKTQDKTHGQPKSTPQSPGEVKIAPGLLKFTAPKEQD